LPVPARGYWSAAMLLVDALVLFVVFGGLGFVAHFLRDAAT
jgi:hypothetical protein